MAANGVNCQNFSHFQSTFNFFFHSPPNFSNEVPGNLAEVDYPKETEDDCHCECAIGHVESVNIRLKRRTFL